MLPKNELGFATRSLGHWDHPGSVPRLPAVPLTDISITSSQSPHPRESILPSQPRRARTRGLFFESLSLT